MINRRLAFIVGIKGTKLSNREILFLKTYKPWGIILFSRNIKNFSQLKCLINDIKKVIRDKKYPILIDNSFSPLKLETERTIDVLKPIY